MELIPRAMKVWASRRSIRETIADVPEGWLDRFMIEQPQDVRKYGTAVNSTLNFRVDAVLQAIEDGMYFRAKDAEGEDGERGERGEMGETGERGETGEMGERGEK